MATARRMLPAVLLALIVAMPAVADRVPMPQIPAAKGAHCVRPTEWMRKNHMTLLMQLRYEAVHDGIRHKHESLPGCIGCHVSRLANGTYPSASSRAFFCNACHRYVGVSIDCFACHSSRPDAANRTVEAAARLRPGEHAARRHGVVAATPAKPVAVVAAARDTP